MPDGLSHQHTGLIPPPQASRGTKRRASHANAGTVTGLTVESEQSSQSKVPAEAEAQAEVMQGELERERWVCWHDSCSDAHP
jgi:hypothetical protein